MCAPLQLVHGLARAHSQRLIDNRNETRYDVHGLFGIFGNGDEIVGKPGKRYFANYGGTKVAFIHKEACSMRNVYTVCETGFCAGLSALLFLESLPSARVLSFDLGNFPWARPADALLKTQYGPLRFPGVVFGDAAKTISLHHLTHPFLCDVAFVDGDKSFAGRYKSLVALRHVSRSDAHVFLDEVTDETCINGTYAKDNHESHCRPLNEGYWPAVRAYNRAAREGWLQLERCAWPATSRHDGICLARFVKLGHS
jgi:predicted O-methyltransferase YrrM